MVQTDWPLGRIFGFLTKQYLGKLNQRMEHTPVDRNFFPLYLIGKNSGKISQQELADQIMTDKVSMVRILDHLSEDGLIKRTVNPNDRRQHLLSVTEKAEPWISEIEKGLQETNEFFFQLLPPEKRADFLELLSLLICKTKDLSIEEFELFYNRPEKKTHEK